MTKNNFVEKTTKLIKQDAHFLDLLIFGNLFVYTFMQQTQSI